MLVSVLMILSGSMRVYRVPGVWNLCNLSYWWCGGAAVRRRTRPSEQRCSGTPDRRCDGAAVRWRGNAPACPHRTARTGGAARSQLLLRLLQATASHMAVNVVVNVGDVD